MSEILLASHPTPPGTVEGAWVIAALPLAGALIILFAGRRLGRGSAAIALLAVLGSFGLGLATFAQLVARPAAERQWTLSLYRWMTAGDFSVAVDYRIDELSVLMILVVTGIGAVIHLYSIGYMAGDPRESRYFAFLNLFIFAMLTLVMANNFLVLFVGWELVGLASYLLIGFWYERPAAAVAAKKAFIVNRVGDLGLMIGILLIFLHFGTLDFDGVFGPAPALLSTGAATAIALLLFAGAVGKSAQLPLHVWLPDAMEGPTPVSALIHAATMVTAGVYLVARAGALFDLAPAAQTTVVAVGMTTALVAAFIAFAQDDIKRILAYSTVSQLGFMFVAVGVGAASAGIFHLVTHAFFKALLFLAAGSVMHALANRTDITRMGGLFRVIPWTGVTFLIGWLAIIGFPGTAGFFSKDQILEAIYGSGNTVLWVLGLAAAAATGFYMSRLVFLTFFGERRYEEDLRPHESPPVMVFPLVLLAAGSIAAGAVLGTTVEDGRIHQWVTAAVAPAAVEGTVPFPHREGGLTAAQHSAVATAAGLAGAAAAGFLYLGGGFDWRARRERASVLWRAARRGFYVDDAYEFLFTGAGKLGATSLAYVVDVRWIDGSVNRIGEGIQALAGSGRRVQTGFVRAYALAILAGGVAVFAFVVGRVWF